MFEQSANVISDPVVEDYVAAVSSWLPDSDNQHDDVLGDLRDHLREIRLENPSADLTLILGSPRDYARELQTAAGTGSEPGAASGWASRVRAASQGWRAALAPASWAVGGASVAAVIFTLMGGGGIYAALALAGAIVGTLLAVLLWARPEYFRARKSLRNACVVAAALCLVVTALGLMFSSGRGPFAAAELEFPVQPKFGPEVSAVQVYDLDGNKLEGVQLFDQNGQQITLATTPEMGFNTEYLPYRGPNSFEVGNVFPQRWMKVNNDRASTGTLLGTGPDTVAPVAAEPVPPTGWSLIERPNGEEVWVP